MRVTHLGQHLPACSQEVHTNGLSLFEHHCTCEAGSVPVKLPYHMVEYIKYGEKLVHSAGTTVTAHQGEALFLERGHYYVRRLPSKEQGRYESIVMCICHEQLSDICLAAHSGTTASLEFVRPYVGRWRANTLLQSALRSLEPYFGSDNRRDQLLKLKFHELVLLLLEHDEHGQLAAILRETACEGCLDLRSFMLHNYCQPYTVEEFAKLSHRSLATFKREFKRQLNDVPRRWITERRLETAAQLLTTSSTQVTEVAFLVGFVSLSHFIQAFKKQYGVTPGGFRKQHSLSSV